MQMRIECDVETTNENVYSDPLCDTVGYLSHVRTPISTSVNLRVNLYSKYNSYIFQYHCLSINSVF